MDNRFACTLDGRCELDNENGYYTLEQCTASCRPVDIPLDTAYASLAFMGEEVLRLAPSDRVEAVYQITEVIVPSEETVPILQALLYDDLATLACYPELYHWAERNLYPAEWAITLQEEGTPVALAELSRLSEFKN